MVRPEELDQETAAETTVRAVKPRTVDTSRALILEGLQRKRKRNPITAKDNGNSTDADPTKRIITLYYTPKSTASPWPVPPSDATRRRTKIQNFGNLGAPPDLPPSITPLAPTPLHCTTPSVATTIVNCGGLRSKRNIRTAAESTSMEFDSITVASPAFPPAKRARVAV